MIGPEEPEQDGIEEPSWAGLVERIRDGEASGMEELYRVFSEGVRFQLWRQLGTQDLDDKVHDVFLIVAAAIRTGELRQPERLMGFVRTVVRRQLANYIDHAVRARNRLTPLTSVCPVAETGPDPERAAIEKQHLDLAMKVLNGVSKKQREVLVRFYLREQTAEEICREMGITETQFRLLKSRAKLRFQEMARSRLNVRIPHAKPFRDF
jgi:RNA polymerase sigma factor (sigma-70 family)